MIRKAGDVHVEPVGVTFVGDVMPGRKVGRSIQRVGPQAAARQVRAMLRGALAVGNLECPLYDAGPARQAKDDGGPNLHAQESMADWLREAGFGAVCLANNHMMDCGPTGLLRTMAVLRQHGLRYFGAGETYDRAVAPAIVQVGRRRMALLAFGNGPAATRNSPGVAPFRTQAVLDALRGLGGDLDATVVLFHSGIEYLGQPERELRDLADDALEAGADLVLCGHSHCLRGMTRRGAKSVYFGLGDFVMDTADDELQAEHLQRTALTKMGFAIAQPLMCRRALAVDVAVAGWRLLEVTHRPMEVGEDFLPREPQGETLRQWQDEFELLCEALDRPDHPLTRRAEEIQRKYRQLFGTGKSTWDYLSLPLRVRPRHVKRLWRRLATIGLRPGGVC